MSVLSDFEDSVSRALEGMFAGVFRSPVQPAELAKALAKAMDRDRSVGVGKVYAPNVYTVLLSPDDDAKFGAFAETLAGELATFLVGHARERDYELASKPRGALPRRRGPQDRPLRRDRRTRLPRRARGRDGRVRRPVQRGERATC